MGIAFFSSSRGHLGTGMRDPAAPTGTNGALHHGR